MCGYLQFTWGDAMLTRLSAILVLAMSMDSIAQEIAIPEVTYPTLAGEASDVAGFVPKGWKLDHQQSGDLNGDGLADVMFVLIDDDPKNLVSDASFSENPVNTNPRILAVAFADKSGAYKLALQDHTLIPRIIEPMFEDPLQKDASVISNGSFKIAFYGFGGTIWQPQLQFRFQHNQFELIGFEDSRVERNSGTTVSTSLNYLTHKVEITTGSIENDVAKTVRKKLKSAPLLTLQKIGSGLDFNPLPEE
jgi:hypothetical protein